MLFKVRKQGKEINRSVIPYKLITAFKTLYLGRHKASSNVLFVFFLGLGPTSSVASHPSSSNLA